ncbi:YkgJ family cysteine cluster protein [uncultured Sunxiuqinia sp.]|uniref:YkgJ family cysteine cluster protein n=1 Tax=uncultured Sunxiuqinia sp. TaxID=1573825 RepID=UPI002AA5F707|nr:YkgJ family cysteine cluster protein [uncultured Sunxiuqinia sp.]
MAEGLSEHEQLFYNDGYQLGLQAAKNNYAEDDLFQAMAQMYQAIDQLIESLSAMAQKQGIAIHCRKGCDYCCRQAVFANSYELHYLDHFIKKNFSNDQKNQVREKAMAKNKQTSALEEKDMLNFKSPCALLKNGSCTAYEARPMACRIYLSTNVISCIEFYQNPENENNYPALLNFPLMAGRMMNEGFIAALKENGIEIAEFRLEEGLKNVLNG